MGWVAEGQRTARMSLTTATKAANYVTFGEEDQVTFEAESAAETFEDILATETMRVLQKCMLKEEMVILGGNASLALKHRRHGHHLRFRLRCRPGGGDLQRDLRRAHSGGIQEFLIVVGGVATSQTITGADGQTYVLNGGSSMKSAAATQAVTTRATFLFASVAAITGAVAYAWYVGVGTALTKSCR